MIRKAERRDIEAIMNIYNEEIMHGIATFDLEPKTWEDRCDWFEEHKGNHYLFVYEKEGTVAGYASLSGYRYKKAYDASVELSVYIDKNYRRMGIGNQLMEAILEKAKEDNSIHTIISVITAGNEASIKMHESFGFTYCGRVKEAGYKFNQYLDIDTYQLMV